MNEKYFKDVSWSTDRFNEGLAVLCGKEKLFYYDKIEAHNGTGTVYQCCTVIEHFNEDYKIVATAPTKIESYQVALVTILKEFYNVPFNEYMMLPIDQIGESLIYPQFFNVSTEMERFILKERVYSK